jgi:pyrimidine-nucleoside phosphorylase
MSQPLGRAVGNALEVGEALDTLQGDGPPEFTDFAIELASLIVELATERASGRAQVEQALHSGGGAQAFRRMIEAQGGDAAAFEDRRRLPTARLQIPLVFDSKREGYLARLDALTVAHACTVLGAGRERKGDPIDLAVGVKLQAKVGDPLAPGQPVAILHANDESRLAEAERVMRSAIELSPTPVQPPALILERLGMPAARARA